MFMQYIFIFEKIVLDFNLLNGGITIIARGCEVDNNNKTITL